MTPIGMARRPEQAWLLAGALVVLALLFLGLMKVVSVHRNATARLNEIEPRAARIAGLLQDSERMAKVDQALQANLGDFVYPADGDAGQIGNQALQHVRDAATAHGLRVSSSQVAAAREEQGFDRIGLSVRVEGDWAQMQDLLAELARQRPAIYSATVLVAAQGGYAGHKLDLSGQFELYALKERKP